MATALLINFSEAEAIGLKLADRTALMMGDAALGLARDDLGWADMVQFVLREARGVIDARESFAENAKDSISADKAGMLIANCIRQVIINHGEPLPTDGLASD